jgi:hypothetical protein
MYTILIWLFVSSYTSYIYVSITMSLYYVYIVWVWDHSMEMLQNLNYTCVIYWSEVSSPILSGSHDIAPDLVDVTINITLHILIFKTLMKGKNLILPLNKYLPIYNTSIIKILQHFHWMISYSYNIYIVQWHPLNLELYRDYQTEWERKPRTAIMYEKVFFSNQKPDNYTRISLLAICQVLKFNNETLRCWRVK